MPEATAPARRTRRFDPDRRGRVVTAAIEVIAEHGVAGLTARRVAAAADVPLGSISYHFAGVTELLREAFAQHAEVGAAEYAGFFEGVATRAGLVDAVTDLIHASAGDERSWVVTYELYVAAQRDPALRAITERWMAASRSVLGRVLDPEGARGLDALLNGLIIHRGLATDPPTREQTRALVAAHLGEPA